MLQQFNDFDCLIKTILLYFQMNALNTSYLVFLLLFVAYALHFLCVPRLPKTHKPIVSVPSRRLLIS